MSTTYPCWHCGQLVPDGQRACPRCGALQAVKPFPAAKPVQTGVSVTVLAMRVVLALIGAVVVYAFLTVVGLFLVCFR